MKKYLLVLGLILSPVLAATAAAADCPQMQQQQDQAFVETLARQVEAPASPALPDGPQAVAAVTFCPAVWCTEDGLCWDNCPGGVGGSYCNRAQHRCYPY